MERSILYLELGENEEHVLLKIQDFSPAVLVKNSLSCTHSLSKMLITMI